MDASLCVPAARADLGRSSIYVGPRAGCVTYPPTCHTGESLSRPRAREPSVLLVQYQAVYYEYK